MSKKTESERKKADEDEDLDEESEGSEGEDEEVDEKPAVSAKAGGSRARARAAAPRAPRDEDHGHGHDDDEEEDDHSDDPYWWTPHAVLTALVLVGVLGFFGAFNKALGGLAAKPAGGDPSAAHADATAGHKEPPKQGAQPPAPGPQPAQAGETYGAKHLLVMYKGSMRAPATITRSEDEAKARATEAQKKAKGGTKFEDLVKEYSDEPGAAQRGGDLGTFRKGQMVPEFQNAVEKMKVGDVSDLVKTPFGYHVILRTK
jgi:hypothetical protein